MTTSLYFKLRAKENLPKLQEKSTVYFRFPPRLHPLHNAWD